MITTYDEMQAKVDKILGKQNTKFFHFSIFETTKVAKKDDMSDWEVECPDFDSVFANGKCVFYDDNLFKYGWKKTPYKSRIFNNPLWSDVIKCANRACSGDHCFLESADLNFEKDGIKYYEFFFGS